MYVKRLFWSEMHIRPGRVIRPRFDEGQVKWTHTLTNFIKLRRHTSVAAKEQSATRPVDAPAAPERPVLVEKRASGEVSAWGEREFYGSEVV